MTKLINVIENNRRDERIPTIAINAQTEAFKAQTKALNTQTTEMRDSMVY